MSDGTSSILDQIISTQAVSHRDNFKPRERLVKLLSLLQERERAVVTRRFGLAGGLDETLDNIGQSFQVTRERIRQIERLAVQKLRESTEAKAILEPLQEVVVEVMEAEGGIMTAVALQRELGRIGDGAHANVIKFFLSELLLGVVAPVGGENTTLVPGWRLRNASLEVLEQMLARAQDIIMSRNVPWNEDELGRALVSAKLINPLSEPLVNSHAAVALLELSQNIKHNSFGEWGLAHWETVTPKRMNDKIYLVLKKHGTPLHFKELARLVNEQGFDKKIAYPPTVHNELILDKRYVLVGRGVYALTEWGYKPGVVADVLVDILRTSNRPMGREELVTAVSKQRVVKKGTIHLALTNKNRFVRGGDGKYSLAEILQQPSDRSSVNVPNHELGITNQE